MILRSFRQLALTVSSVALFSLGAGPAQGQIADVTPEQLEDIGIEPHLEAQLPLDATFLDSEGREVTLGDYFDGERPVVILPVYFSCPMLCGVTSNALLNTAKDLKWTPGEEYRIVVFSFDPRETPRLAKLKKENTLKEFGRDIPDDAWVFLTGQAPSIERLTDTLGFKYQWNEKRQEYVHAAGLMVCTPEGRISQYMTGVMYKPDALRLLLVEAAAGKVGSPLDQILLFCFHYDPEEGTYAWAAVGVMRVGGTLTVLILLLTVTPLWLRSHFKQKRHAQAAATQGGDPPMDAAT